MANNYNSYKSRYTGNQVDNAVGKAQNALNQDDIVQTTGQYANKVMSQGAVTELFRNTATNENIENAITTHNVSNTAHQDIRTMINNKPNALNYRTDSLFNTYTTRFINDNFASITFVNNLYAQKTGENTASFVNNLPALNDQNILTSTDTTNTYYDWNSPDFIFTRELQVNTTMAAQNSFELNLKFMLSRNATLSFGMKLKVSTDNGTTWNDISTNQTTSSQAWDSNVGNTVDLLCYTDLLLNPTTYNIGTLLAFEVYKKQQSNQHLTTTVYCGVLVDDAPIYTYVKFNFTNVNLGTGQLEDNSVTYQKLSAPLQQIVDKVPQITHKIETSIIYPGNWSTLLGNQLFNYYAIINLTSQVFDNTIIELVNDNPVDFALYGFSLMEYNQTLNTVTIYAISAPLTSINFTLEIYETESILPTLYAPRLYYPSQEYNPTIIQIDNNIDNPSTVNYYLYYDGDNFTNQIGQADPEYPTIDLRNITELREAGEYTLKARVVSLINPGNMSDFSDSLTYVSSGSQEETGLYSSEKYLYDSTNDEVTINGTTYTMSSVSRVKNGTNTYPATYNSSTDMYDFTINGQNYSYNRNAQYLISDSDSSVYLLNSQNEVTINNITYTYNFMNSTFSDGTNTYSPSYDSSGQYWTLGGVNYRMGYKPYVTDGSNYFFVDYDRTGEYVTLNGTDYYIEIGQALTDGTNYYYYNQENVIINGVIYSSTIDESTGYIEYFTGEPVKTTWADLLSGGYVTENIDNSISLDNSKFSSNYLYELFIPSTITTITANNFSGCLIQYLYFNAYIAPEDVGANAFDSSSIIEVVSNYSDESIILYPEETINTAIVEFIVQNSGFDFSTLSISMYGATGEVISQQSTETGMIFTVQWSGGIGSFSYNASATGYNTIYGSVSTNYSGDDKTVYLTFNQGV